MRIYSHAISVPTSARASTRYNYMPLGKATQLLLVCMRIVRRNSLDWTRISDISETIERTPSAFRANTAGSIGDLMASSAETISISTFEITTTLVKTRRGRPLTTASGVQKKIARTQSLLRPAGGVIQAFLRLQKTGSNTGAPFTTIATFPAPRPGCDRVNGKGYFRKADFRAHLRKVHGTDSALPDDDA